MAVTANGEVQTNEEAQVYVHDLGLFVTVQLSEVLSLGTLCEKHVYSLAWASGQRPQLTKQGKKILCRTDNFVPFVIPGVSASSGSSSSSTSPVQKLPSSSSMTERSGEQAPGNWRETHQTTKNQNKKKDDNRDSDERLRHLPEWLEECADNLEDRDVDARTHFSGLRFGTFFKSGINNKEAQFLYSLPERPKLRSMLACGPR